MNTKPELKQYQEKARDELARAILQMLGSGAESDRLVVYKAPTGSGKTVTAAYALAAAHQHPNRKEFVVLWLSPGKGGLHTQSARALSRFLQGTSMQVRLLDSREDIDADPTPPSGSVLVVNWEKLFRQDGDEFKNVMLRDGETTSLFAMLDNVTAAGMDMVAIIDESHVNLDAPKTLRLVEELRLRRPFIRIEMSATPSSSTRPELRADGFHHDVVVRFSDVEAEGMVRRTVLLNPDFDAVQKRHPGEPLDRQVLHAAWERMNTLRNGYEAEGSRVKPLLLIQYPDGKNAEARAAVVEKFLSEKGLEKDVTYATYLSGDHSDDLENIANFESPYQALIFKQAIATGWDCPRAQVLVQFRDPRSATFRIQTLGRIMRSPEQRHYENEHLNIAYVYSDLEGVGVDVVSDEPDYKVRDQVMKRKSVYPEAGLRLQSVFQPRKRELHYPMSQPLTLALTAELSAVFDGALPVEPIESTPVGLLTNASIDARELLVRGSGDFEGDRGEGTLGPEMTQAFYDQVLTHDIGQYRSREQSRSRIKTALVNWVKKQRPDWTPEHIQHLVLNHQTQVSRAISIACTKCALAEDAKAVADARARRRTNDEWEVPASDLVSSDNYEISEVRGCLMEPELVEKARSEPERRFESWIGKQVEANAVQWWWKNGERDEKYLAIEYAMNSVVERTYPDYLVMTSEGKLWVLEVKDVDDKDGAVGAATSAKAAGLNEWAEQQNARRADKKDRAQCVEVGAGVVVIHPEGNSLIARVGNHSAWTSPTKENLVTGSGWSVLSFGSTGVK